LIAAYILLLAPLALSILQLLAETNPLVVDLLNLLAELLVGHGGLVQLLAQSDVDVIQVQVPF
jgi:hypothetical protein